MATTKKRKPKNPLASVKLNTGRKPKVTDEQIGEAAVRLESSVSAAERDSRIFYCSCCGVAFKSRQNNFPKTSSILFGANKGYPSICRPCMEKYYATLVDFFQGDEALAIERICQLFDLYYSDKAFKNTEKYAGEVSRVNQYFSVVKLGQYKKGGSDYLQTIRDRASFNLETGERMTTTGFREDREGPPMTDGDFTVTREMIKTWGKGYKPDEYEYLEEQYADWKAKNDISTKTQEELYKNICFAQLNVRRAQMYGGKVVESQKVLQDLMNSVAILPKHAKDTNDTEDESWGTLIQKYEETRPISEPAPEWKDVDNVRKYFNTWVRGGLGKALHLKNENVALYEEAAAEFNKYTVKPTQSGIGVENLGDSLFGQEEQKKSEETEGDDKNEE